MIDIPSITSALAGIKNATDIAKLIKNSSASLEQAEIDLKLADLIGALADAKIEIANIKQEILDKNDKIKSLEQVAELSGKMLYEAPYYFLVDGEKKDGPFCQKCYDSHKKLIRLQEDRYQKGSWGCRECSCSYHDSRYTSPSYTPRPAW